MTLGDFLKAAASDRGPWNCCTFPADWCIARGHSDFAVRWRHVVDDDEAEEMGRDMLPLWRRAIGHAMPEVEPAYEAGDVGLVQLPDRQAGAIFTGQRWAFRKPRGLILAAMPDSDILKAWRP